jgi:hypothetical protein
MASMNHIMPYLASLMPIILTKNSLALIMLEVVCSADKFARYVEKRMCLEKKTQKNVDLIMQISTLQLGSSVHIYLLFPSLFQKPFVFQVKHCVDLRLNIRMLVMLQEQSSAKVDLIYWLSF